jgi:hypothetical protein
LFQQQMDPRQKRDGGGELISSRKTGHKSEALESAQRFFR